MANEGLNEDSKGWKEEVEAIIKDIKDHVISAEISNVLESTDTAIYVNLTTKEGKELTVELTFQGFAVVGTRHDTFQPQSETKYYETIYSLLDEASAGYRQSFGNSLSLKLKNLHDEQV